MGGQVQSGQQNTSQNTSQLQNQTGTSTLSPFGPAASTVSGILGGLSNVNPGLSGTQSDALQQLIAQGQAGSPFTGGISNTVNSLLAGGGAAQFAPIQSDAYNRLLSELSPVADPNNLNPYNTPGFGQALATTNADISNQINQQFAMGNRSGSGMNEQTLARGLAQGEGGLLQGQYNQNVQNLINAGSQMFGGGTTTAQNLLGINQTGIGNQVQGANLAPTALTSQQYGPMLELQAAAQQTGIPLQTLAAMAGITLPIAAGFGTTTGTNQGYGTGTNVGQTTTSTPLWQSLAGGLLGGAGLVGATGGFGNSGWLTNLLKSGASVPS